MRFGRFIEARRKELGLSVTQLAEKAGLSQPYLSQLEQGNRANPSPSTISALSEALGVPVDKLESLVEVQSPDAEQLRVAVKKAKKVMVRLPEIASEVGQASDFILDTMRTLQKERDLVMLREGASGGLRPEYPPKASDVDRFVKAVSNLHSASTSLPPLLDRLASTFDVPKHPEHIDDLVHRMDALGDDGLKALDQVVSAMELLIRSRETSNTR